MSDPSVVSKLTQSVDAQMPALTDELTRLVGIPSVSEWGFPAHTRPAVLQAHDVMVELPTGAGVQQISALELPGTAPIITGTIPGPQGAPTVLLYGHYDVVGAGEESEWQTPPFEATRRGEEIFGRGVADSKSNLLVHIGALRAYRHPLIRRPDGTLSTTVVCHPGTTLYFRYLGSDGSWFDDMDADEINDQGCVLLA